MTRYISLLTIMFITQTINRELEIEFLKALEIETS